MKIIDLTHTFKDNMPVFPGDPQTSVKQITSHENEGYFDTVVTTNTHVGTHMDAPLHMIEDGKMMSDIDVSRFIGPGFVINANGKEKIDLTLLESTEGYNNIREGMIVLIYTGFAKKFGSDEYFNHYPCITEEFAQRLVDIGIKCVGIDTPSPDKKPFNIHKLLLRNDVLIIENLTNIHLL